MRWIVTALTALLSLAALPAQAAQTERRQEVTTVLMSPAEQSASLAYWTRERISATSALPMPAAPESDLQLLDRRPAASKIAPQSTAPEAPQEDADAVARSYFWRDWLEVASGGETDPGPESPEGTPGVYTYYDVNTQSALWNILPHKRFGRLVFQTPAGGASCSATVISGNHVVTAAHCLYDSTANTWFSNWVFTPAFRNGAAPYGTFAAANCTILNAWINLTGNYSLTWVKHDVAVCRLGTNGAGQTINAAVGSAGRLWNAPNTQLVFNSGYPARNYNNVLIANGPAQFLRSCTAETSLYSAETLRMGCFWGSGISGGSWLKSYKPFVNSGQVNSVNSGIVVGQPNIYGARFNSNNIVVLCNASGC